MIAQVVFDLAMWWVALILASVAFIVGMFWGVWANLRRWKKMTPMQVLALHRQINGKQE